VHKGACNAGEALYSLGMQHHGAKPPDCGPFSRAQRMEHLGARLTQGRRYGAARRAFSRAEQLAKGASRHELALQAQQRRMLQAPSGSGDTDEDAV